VASGQGIGGQLHPTPEISACWKIFFYRYTELDKIEIVSTPWKIILRRMLENCNRLPPAFLTRNAVDHYPVVVVESIDRPIRTHLYRSYDAKKSEVPWLQ